MFGRRKSEEAVASEAPRLSEELPTSLHAARSRLRIRAYGADQVEVDRIEATVAGTVAATSALRPVSAEISVGVVIDVPDGWVKVSDRQLRAWGCTLDDALGAALDATRSAEFSATRLGEASLLIQDDAYAGVPWVAPQVVSSLPIAGGPIAWALTRGMTLVTGSDDPEGAEVAASVAQQLIQGGERVESVTPHRLGDHGWEAIAWAPVAENADALAQRLYKTHVYARQADPLHALLAAGGRNVFMSAHDIYRRPDGQPWAVATWTEGVLAALPVADEIVLVREDGGTLGIPWAPLYEQAQDLLEPVTDRPARYLTTGFPTDEMVNAALG